MGAQRVKQLKAELGRIRSRGTPARALEILSALEQLEPREGAWPHRAAEIHRRAKDEAQEIAALLRAAERFRAAGFLLKAIAVCKRVLALSPDQRAAQETLAALSQQRGIPADSEPRPPAPPQTARASTARESEARESEPTTHTLEEIVLTEMVASGPPTGLVTRGAEASGLAEIDLGDSLEHETPAPERANQAHDAATSDARSEMLLHTPLFASLASSDLARLVRGAQILEVAEGSNVFQEGDSGDALFVIVEGAIALISDIPRRRMLAALAEGQFFGESALLRCESRNATARAVVDTTLIRVDQALIRSMIARSPRVLVVLLCFLRDRMTQRLMRTSPLFEGLSRSEQAKLGKRFHFVEAAPGIRLIRRGEASPALYFVLSGMLDVSMSDDDTSHPDTDRIAVLEPGDVFGEMSLISNTAAVASVWSRSKCWLLYMTAQEVQELLRDPRIRTRIQAVASERRAQHVERAAEDLADHRISLD